MAGSKSGAGQDEKSLLQRIQNGESELFSDLVRDCHRAVFTAAFSILRNATDAEEVCQEAIAKAWAALGGFRMQSKFSTWLVQITMNEARMRLRKEKNRHFRSLDESVETGKGIYVPEQLIEWRRIPSRELERKRMREALVRAFESLPEKYREIFVLRDVQGLSIAQSAKLVGVTEATVKTRLLRARLRLRDLLAEPTARNTPVLLKKVTTIPCIVVWRGVSDYVDNDAGPSIRAAIETHIANCTACRAVVHGVRNVVQLFGDPRLFPLPKGFRRRALQRVRARIAELPVKGTKRRNGGGR